MWRNIGIIVFAVVLGYASNALSQSACLENAAFWYSHVLMSGQPFHVKLESGQESISQALDNVQASYTVITRTSGKTVFPQVSIRTNLWIPFIISEQFDAAMDATKRATFTAHYVAFFGVPLSVGDSFDIPTPPQSPPSTTSQTVSSQNSLKSAFQKS
jgi:hypothetical protein